MADETYIKTQIIAPTMAINYAGKLEIILTNSSKLSQIVETISYYLIEYCSLIKLQSSLFPTLPHTVQTVTYEPGSLAALLTRPHSSRPRPEKARPRLNITM